MADEKEDMISPVLDSEKAAEVAANPTSSGGACGTSDDLLPRRDFPPRYPDIHRVSWSEATKDGNQIDVGKIGSGGDFFTEDIDDDDEDDALDEFFEVPR